MQQLKLGWVGVRVLLQELPFYNHKIVPYFYYYPSGTIIPAIGSAPNQRGDMRYWYGYTGENLLLGHGRAIRQVFSVPQTLEPLLRQANQQAQQLLETPTSFANHIPYDTLVAALMTPLAVHELGTNNPTATPFSSAAQLFALFEGADVKQVAINLYNGRKASTYNSDEQVVQGFESGELLFLPQDTSHLNTPEFLNNLPSIAVFLLRQTEVEQKAFAEYLRRGTPPVASDKDQKSMAAMRPVLSTWAREARLEREMVQRDADV